MRRCVPARLVARESGVRTQRLDRQRASRSPQRCGFPGSNRRAENFLMETSAPKRNPRGFSGECGGNVRSGAPSFQKPHYDRESVSDVILVPETGTRMTCASRFPAPRNAIDAASVCTAVMSQRASASGPVLRNEKCMSALRPLRLPDTLACTFVAGRSVPESLSAAQVERWASCSSTIRRYIAG